jgi:Spherulation-specific family 4
VRIVPANARDAAAANAGRRAAALRGLKVMLRTAAAVLLPVVAACSCGTAAPPAALRSPSHVPAASPAPGPSLLPSPSRTGAPHASASARPSPTPIQPPAAATAGGCQDTYIPSMFYASSDWAQAIDTKPAPRVMLLNVDNGVGSAPVPHFQVLVRQAQAAGITVLGYSSTDYGQRPAGSVETEVRQYRAWYGVNGILLDLTQGTPGELSYYRELTGYIRAIVPHAVVWLNPGDYPDPSFMSLANVVMVFEGSYAQYVADQVPGWVSQYQPDQFVHVIYATPRSDLASAVRLSRARRAGYLFVTDLPGSPNPYDAMPSYWPREVAAVTGKC